MEQVKAMTGRQLVRVRVDMINRGARPGGAHRPGERGARPLQRVHNARAPARPHARTQNTALVPPPVHAWTWLYNGAAHTRNKTKNSKRKAPSARVVGQNARILELAATQDHGDRAQAAAPPPRRLLMHAPSPGAQVSPIRPRFHQIPPKAGRTSPDFRPIRRSRMCPRYKLV